MAKTKDNNLKFIDLFAGIGGFHLALHDLGAKCVFASEWDEPARQTYEKNFKKIQPFFFEKGLFAKKGQELFAGDITKVNPKKIPDFDILCGGFPCQPFSISGKQKGFQDTRGTLFFNVLEIIKAKKPKVVFLENVKHLKYHDNKKTLSSILNGLRAAEMPVIFPLHPRTQKSITKFNIQMPDSVKIIYEGLCEKCCGGR